MEVLIFFTPWIFFSTPVEAWQAIARFSGRLSLLVFAIIFVLQGSRHAQHLPDRPYLVFAIIHGIHLVELLVYVGLSQRDLIPIRLAGGFVAYLIIFVMPWIEHQFKKDKITTGAMTIFENVSLYYVWFIFLMAYIPRVLGKLPDAGGSFIEHVTLLIFVILIFTVRFTRQIRGYIVKK